MTLVIWALCAYRVTRLIVEDSLFDWLRHATIHKLPESSYFRELFECPYCTSVWVSFGVIAAWTWGGSIARFIIQGLAIAGAVALAWKAVEDAPD